MTHDKPCLRFIDPEPGPNPVFCEVCGFAKERHTAPAFHPNLDRDRVGRCNDERADDAEAAVVYHFDTINPGERYAGSERSALIGMLTDLQHFCHRENLEFDIALAAARGHFNYEKA